MLDNTPSDQELEEIVSFTIGNDYYCMSIATVLEIRGWTQTTILPHAPDYVVGMMNLRGTVLPVIDLSRRLGLGKTEPNSRHVIIIATVREKTTGFLVDSVSDILTVGSSDLQPPPQIVNSTGNQFIKGILSLEDTILRFIDVTCIVDNETS